MARLLIFTLLVFGITTLTVSGNPGGGNSVCAKWCAYHFANPGNNCTSLAAKGEGPCYVCGPEKTSQSECLCQGECVDTSTDSNNCGSCGYKCGTNFECNSGKCYCPGPFDDCIIACTDLRFDNLNCGTCGHKCPANSECVNADCRCINGFGLPCNDVCPSVLSPTNVYCYCGTPCPAGYKCSGGACIAA